MPGAVKDETLAETISPGSSCVGVMFIVSAFAVMAFAGYELLQAIVPSTGHAVSARIEAVLNSIALLTIAVAALELAQTIVEEEIQRESHMSSPSRVRRFLVVLVVAMSIEALVAAFRFSRDDPSQLSLCRFYWFDGGGAARRVGRVHTPEHCRGNT